MNNETYTRAQELVHKIQQCFEALSYMTHGTYHHHGDKEYTVCDLPDEVCVEIRKVIDKYQCAYQAEFTSLSNENDSVVQDLEQRIEELIAERNRAQAELTDIKNKQTYALDLRLDEIDLLNILRGYGERTIFIRKDKQNDAWKAECLINAKK